MRTPRRLVAAGALSALALAGIPSAGAQTPTVTEVIGAADGLSVDLDLVVLNGDTPPLTFGPAPSVVLPPEGGSESAQILGVAEQVLFVSLTARVLSAATEGALGPDGFATAETSVLDIVLAEVEPPPIPPSGEVGAQQLLLEDPILAAELITATCAADLDGVSGSTTLVGASVLGEDLAVEPEPNTVIQIDIVEVASATVTLNQQVENEDGSLSVTALLIEVEVAGLLTGTVQVGPATCGVVEGVIPAEVVPAPEEVTPAQPAPAQPAPAAPRFTG